MNKLILKLLLFLIPILLFSNEKTCDLTVVAVDFSSNEGQAIIDLHNIPDAFPTKRDKAYKQIKTKINDNKIEITFKNLPYGEYAVSVHHDENGNDEVDTNFIGIPNEDFGASNNATGSFGPPDFEDAKIILNSQKKTIQININ